MYVETSFKKVGAKLYGPYLILRLSMGRGRKSSLFVRKGFTPFEYLVHAPLKGADFFEKADKYHAERDKAMGKVPDIKRRIANMHSSQRRMIKSILESAGYSVRGKEIKRNKKTFFTPEATRIRYSLLDDISRERVGGSPEELRMLCLEAHSKMKSANARGKKDVTFENCLVQCLVRKTGAVASVAAKP